MGLFDIFRRKQPTKLNTKKDKTLSYFEHYINGISNIKFQYNHQVSLLDNKFIKHNIEADEILPQLLNVDIMKTLEHAKREGISVITISYKGLKFDNLIDEKLKPNYVSTYNNYIVYLNDNAIRTIVNSEYSIVARISKYLDSDIRLIGNDNNGNQKTFLIMAGDNNVKPIDGLETDKIVFLGEYFGVIEWKGVAYFCYATLPIA